MGEPERAIESLVRYLQVRGRDADRFEEALDLLNRAEAEKARDAGTVRWRSISRWGGHGPCEHPHRQGAGGQGRQLERLRKDCRTSLERVSARIGEAPMKKAVAGTALEGELVAGATTEYVS